MTSLVYGPSRAGGSSNRLVYSQLGGQPETPSTGPNFTYANGPPRDMLDRNRVREIGGKGLLIAGSARIEGIAHISWDDHNAIAQVTSANND